MDRYEFYKERYYNELERKGSTMESHGIPISLLTGLLAALFYFVTNLGLEDVVFNWALFLFFILMIPSLIFISAAFYYLYRSYSGGYKYYNLPNTDALQKHEVKLLEEFKGQDNANQLAKKKFRGFLIKQFIECTATNTVNNNKRAHFLFWANRMLICAITCIALSTAPFFIHQYKFKKTEKQENAKEIFYIYT